MNKDEEISRLAAECERVRAANLDCVDHFNQAMAARDAALAELAALKGGQASAGFQRATILKDCNVRYSADTAPPAQASAWVPEGLPAALFNALEAYKKCADLFEGERDKGIHQQQCELIRQHAAAMLSAAPTPGASDGNGGE